MTARAVEPYRMSEIERAFPIATEPNIAAIGNVVAFLPGRRPTVFDTITNTPDMNAAAQAGMDRNWFERLSTDKQNDLLRQIFALPNIATIANASRQEWLPLIWGAAHAEKLGATQARQIALEWSATGASFDLADFDRSWASFRENRT